MVVTNAILRDDGGAGFAAMQSPQNLPTSTLHRKRWNFQEILLRRIALDTRPSLCERNL